MSTSMVLCYSNILFSDQRFASYKPLYLDSVIFLSSVRRKGTRGLVPNAKKKHNRKRSWWKKFFFDEDGNWLGLKDDDMLDAEEESGKNSSDDEGLFEGEKFEAWKRRAEAIVELREGQENVQNEEKRKWEDWLLDGTNGGSISNGNGSSWFQEPRDGDVGEDLSDLIPRKALAESMRDMVFGRDEDEILYEDRVFRYASFNSVKFLAVLIVVPWVLDFLVHDYVLMPFLDRYVKTVPLAAEILDVRKHQKLEMVKELKIEKERYKFEVEIGKSPPISEEELYLELRHKALLNSLTQALHNSGVDLTQATVSVQVDLGKRANRGLTSGTSTATAMDHENPHSSNQPVGRFQEFSNGENSDQASKRRKAR